MLYDGGLMRSILALALALLVLGAETSGLFLESPVCAVVDGAPHSVVRKPAEKGTPSCCGSPTCPMKGSGCGKGEACPMGAAGSSPAVPSSSEHQGTSGAKLCAPSCGGEGARIVPGTPDPGTLETISASIANWSSSGALAFMSSNLPARNPVPDDPPPRA